MNIVRATFQNNIDLAVCIFPSDMLLHNQLKEVMTDYTTFYAHRLEQVCSKLDILYAESIDQGLEKYSQYKHILFMAAGVRIYDAEIILEIVEEIEKHPNYLAAAHILEWKNNWYELHHQFVLVNVGNWNIINRPKFGDWKSATDDLVVINRSIENFHDDYTPLWIKDTGLRQLQYHNKQGWNFIDKGLRSGLSIINWNQSIRNKRTYYYPETDSDIFFKSYMNKHLSPRLINYNQKKLIKEISTGVSNQIWAINSEHMHIQNADKKYNIVALPASGFKYLDIFKSNALNDNGTILIYDYNQLSLDWIKHIYNSKTTDIAELVKSFPHNKNLKWFGYNNDNILINGQLANSFVESFDITKSFFKGKFEQYLNQFRRSSVKFIKTDLIYNYFNLLNEIDDSTCLLHVSNIYATDFIVSAVGLKQADYLFSKFRDILHPNTKIVGHTPNGKFLT